MISSAAGVVPEEEDLPIPDEDDDEASQQYLGLIDIFSAPPSGFGTGAKVNARAISRLI